MGTAGSDHELRLRERPCFEAGAREFHVADLFAGCGGLTLGVAQATHNAGLALNVKLAVDIEDAAARVYADNFPKANVQAASIDDFFDGGLGRVMSRDIGDSSASGHR